MNSQQLFSKTSMPENETTFTNNGNINTQEKTSIIPEQGTLVSKCTATENKNTSVLNVNSSVETSVVVSTDVLTGQYFTYLTNVNRHMLAINSFFLFLCKWTISSLINPIEKNWTPTIINKMPKKNNGFLKGVIQ